MVVIDSTGHADNMLKMLHDSQTYDGIFLNTDTSSETHKNELPQRSYLENY